MAVLGNAEAENVCEKKALHLSDCIARFGAIIKDGKCVLPAAEADCKAIHKDFVFDNTNKICMGANGVDAPCLMLGLDKDGVSHKCKYSADCAAANLNGADTAFLKSTTDATKDLCLPKLASDCNKLGLGFKDVNSLCFNPKTKSECSTAKFTWTPNAEFPCDDSKGTCGLPTGGKDCNALGLIYKSGLTGLYKCMAKSECKTELINTGSFECVADCTTAENGFGDPATNPNDAATNCMKCSTGCSKCAAGKSSECSDCLDGYVLKDKSCVACMAGCSSCSSDTASTECATCKDGFYGPDTDKKC